MNYKIELNKDELSNLLVFLKRVNLKGEEAIEYVKIINKINLAEEIIDKNDDAIKS
jgi:hypothetical protein